MAKEKFYYDSENLTYKKVKIKRTRQIAYGILFILTSALFGMLSVFIFQNTTVFETSVSREVYNMRWQYNILNRKLNQVEDVIKDLEERDNNVYREYFNIAAITDTERQTRFNAFNKYKELDGYNNSDLINKTANRLSLLRVRLAEQSKSLDVIYRAAKNKEKMLASIPAIQPVRNENLKHMASGFGYRSDPFTKARKMHNGMDFSAKVGSLVYATGDGVVTRADNTASGFGKHIVVNHGFGYETTYAHLSGYKCRSGQRVKRGDVIGQVGNTGRSSGPHLHYEVHYGSKVVNPINFYYGDISAVEYVVISKLANQENQSLD